MKFLLLPVGSAGDVYPYVAIGSALKKRGHDITVVTNPHFEALIKAAGLRFRPWGTIEQFDSLTRNPHLWHERKGLQVISAKLRSEMSALYEIVGSEYERGPLTIVAHGLAFAARLAHETLGVPLVTIHLQPSSLFSVYDTPIFHRWLTSINRLPLRPKRLLLKLATREADRILGLAINKLRAEQHLAPVQQIFRRWWHSPQQVIGLFPNWYANPQPDWPPQTSLTGFVLFDADTGEPLPPAVERFLEEGSPPLVFVPGSANRQASRFFRTAVDACQYLGRRGLLLTRYRAQLPAVLPKEVQWFDYVPLGRLLPRALGLVHHGGIGTAAQGLAAGLPQLIMPMAYDQPDNANRLESLGVARTIWPKSFTGPRLAASLDDLLSSERVKVSCSEIAERIHNENPLRQTCELIERTSQQ